MLKANRKTLVRLLAARFGPPSADLLARIQATDDPERLADATEQVLHIASPDELAL